MNRYLLYISLMASSLLAFTACSDEEHEIIPDIPTEEKTPIELSVGSMGAESATRAITVAPDDNSKLGTLPEGTALFMVMKSEKNGSSSNTKYAVTKGVTEAANESTKESPIDFSEAGCTRYWDDCYARDAQLSVYAACCPGSTKTITIGGKSDYPHNSMPTTGAWSETSIGLTIANWKVSPNQTATTIKNEDLCYSNNIADNSSTSPYTDGRLKFTPSGTGTSGTFAKGNLCFYHALSWITFEIEMGDGFTTNEFQFPEGQNIKLTNFYTSNTEFDIATGEFTGTYSSSVISSISQRVAATYNSMFTLDARVLPTTDMSTDTKGDIDLTIAGNNYKLSKKDLYDKIPSEKKTSDYFLGENKNQLKPGIHYIFTLKISKTKVNISAKIVNWETVTAEELIPSNARIQLQLEDRGTAVTQALAIYRAEDNPSTIKDDYEGYNWSTGYVGNSNTFTNNGGAKWGLSGTWYWPNNMTYYHFRGVSPEGTTVSTEASTSTTPAYDYFLISSGVTYTDALWGAPMRKKDAEGTSYKFNYDKDNGFGVNIDGTDKTQIYQAIGPTEETVKLTLFHMMSEVTFVLTTEESADNKVDLDTAEGATTTLELKNFYKDGRVSIGTGLIQTTGSTSSETISSTLTSTSNKCTYGVVPQDLTDVQVVITTADKNNYIVNMKDVRATAVSENNIKNPYTAVTDGGTTKYNIDRWYPSFKYTYTFKLTKKGIEISATVVDWETVEASDDEVQIQ